MQAAALSGSLVLKTGANRKYFNEHESYTFAHKQKNSAKLTKGLPHCQDNFSGCLRGIRIAHLSSKTRRVSITRVDALLDKPKSEDVSSPDSSDIIRPSSSYRIERKNYYSRRVTIYDRAEEKEVYAVIVARHTPAHMGFSSSQDVWTLDMRLESNCVKIGDLVVGLSPAVGTVGLSDASIFSILNFDTTRFGGVGAALLGHLVYGSWRDGDFVKIHQITATDVDEASLYFWFNLGFRFNSGAEEGDYYCNKEDLNKQLDMVVEECTQCCELEGSMGMSVDDVINPRFGCTAECVSSQAYRIVGDSYDMSCVVSGLWQ